MHKGQSDFLSRGSPTPHSQQLVNVTTSAKLSLSQQKKKVKACLMGFSIQLTLFLTI